MNKCKQFSNKAGIIHDSVLHQCRVDFIHAYTHAVTLLFVCVYVPYLCTIHNRRPHASADTQKVALFLLVM